MSEIKENLPLFPDEEEGKDFITINEVKRYPGYHDRDSAGQYTVVKMGERVIKIYQPEPGESQPYK